MVIDVIESRESGGIKSYPDASRSVDRAPWTSMVLRKQVCTPSPGEVPMGGLRLWAPGGGAALRAEAPLSHVNETRSYDCDF